jgi:hypothetical protein
MLRSWWARWAKGQRSASRRTARARRFILQLEALESRCLLSVTPVLAPQPVFAFANQPFSGLVAHFTPVPNVSVSSGDLSSVINWGDGHTSAATIRPDGSFFDVSGTNTYASSGSFSIVISLSESDGSILTATTTATVAPATIAMMPASTSGLSVDTQNPAFFTAEFAVAGWVAIIANSHIVPVTNPTPSGTVPAPPIASSNSTSLTVLVSSTEHIPYASLREQLPAESAPVALHAPIIFIMPSNPELPSPATDAVVVPVVVTHQPLIVLVPVAREANPPRSPLATSSPAVNDDLWLTTSPAPELSAADMPVRQVLTTVTPALQASPDDGRAVYHRPLQEVADRAELFTLGASVPYLLPQQGPAAPPPLRGDPPAAVTAAAVPPPPPAPEPAPRPGFLRSRAIRYGLLPAAACILHGLGISPIDLPRLPRLRRVRSAPGQE